MMDVLVHVILLYIIVVVRGSRHHHLRSCHGDYRRSVCKTLNAVHTVVKPFISLRRLKLLNASGIDSVSNAVNQSKLDATDMHLP